MYGAGKRAVDRKVNGAANIEQGNGYGCESGSAQGAVHKGHGIGAVSISDEQ